MEDGDQGNAQLPRDGRRVAGPLRPIDRFCELVRKDALLHEVLWKLDDVEQFVALVLTIAHEQGLSLGADEVRAAMRMPGASALLDVGDPEPSLPPQGWLPVVAFWRHGQLYLQWSFFGRQRLIQPFFESDVQHAMFKSFSRLIRYVTPISDLAQSLQLYPSLRPSGFIFHMSRCGSTLVSQMLAALSHNVVISEASPIDTVVRAKQTNFALSDDQHILWLQWIVGVLGQQRTGDAQNYFVKLDCWHTRELPLFQRAFPDVPWIFLYRDPVEVLVSHLRMPGMQMIPGALDPNLFNIEPADRVRSPEDYCARILARLCQPVVQQQANAKRLLINYRDLPQALWTAILPHFGVTCSDEDRVAMMQAAWSNAKMPGLAFTVRQRRQAAAGECGCPRRLRKTHGRYLPPARNAALKNTMEDAAAVAITGAWQKRFLTACDCHSNSIRGYWHATCAGSRRSVGSSISFRRTTRAIGASSRCAGKPARATR